MSIPLTQEVQVVKELKGEPFYNIHLPTAQRAAIDYAKEHGTFVAPLTLLLRNFPHGQWYTANSEEHSGIDTDGKFGPNGGHVVVTLHGGREGIGLLTPDIIQTAYDMKEAGKGGINNLYAAVLSDVYAGKDVLTDLLHGGLPDGESIPVLPYEQLRSEGAPADFQRFAVVRTLELARQTEVYFQGEICITRVVRCNIFLLLYLFSARNNSAHNHTSL